MANMLPVAALPLELTPSSISELTGERCAGGVCTDHRGLTTLKHVIRQRHKRRRDSLAMARLRRNRRWVYSRGASCASYTTMQHRLPADLCSLWCDLSKTARIVALL